MLHSHYGVNSFSKIRLKSIVELLVKAIEREQESHVWDRWVRLCPYMEIGHIKFINYNDYKKALLEPSIKHTNKTSEEIIDEMMNVVFAHKKNNDTKQTSF